MAPTSAYSRQASRFIEQQANAAGADEAQDRSMAHVGLQQIEDVRQIA